MLRLLIFVPVAVSNSAFRTPATRLRNAFARNGFGARWREPREKSEDWDIAKQLGKVIRSRGGYLESGSLCMRVASGVTIERAKTAGPI